MTAIMRAKMKINAVVDFEGSQRLVLGAVYKEGAYPEDGSDEDNTFARFTPQADLTMTINNPELLGKFEVGQKLYLDFTPAN